LYQFAKRVTKPTVIIIVGHHRYQLQTKFYQISRLGQYINEIIGNHQCEFRRNRSTAEQIVCIRQILEKKLKYDETVHQLFIEFKKAHDSLRREVLYNILIEFGVPMKLVRLIIMCLNET
jgi:hypothetical protein